MLVDITELPRVAGMPAGQYKLLVRNLNTVLPGARFVDGRTVKPVTGRVLQRLRMAYGPTCEIEPYDDETARAVADYCLIRGRTKRHEQIMAALDSEPRTVSAAGTAAGTSTAKATNGAT